MLQAALLFQNRITDEVTLFRPHETGDPAPGVVHVFLARVEQVAILAKTAPGFEAEQITERDLPIAFFDAPLVDETLGPRDYRRGRE